MKDLWQVKEVDSVFNADLFDLDDWQTTAKAIPGLADANDAAGEQFCGQPIQDGFFSLFKSEPELASPAPAALAPLSSLIQRGMNTPAWQGLREHTTGQAIAAGVASQDFFQQVLKNLPEEAKKAAREQAQRQANADAAQQQAEDLQALADLLREAGQEQEADEAQQQAELQAGLAQSQQAEADQAGQRFEQSLAGNEAQVTAALNNAASHAAKEGQEAQALVTSFSLAAGGDPNHVSPETARAAMEAMQRNPHLKDLAEMLGWAKATVRGEWRKAPKGNRNMTGYRAEALNPARMSASELVAMVSPEPVLQLGFIKRVVEEAVVHKHFEGDEQQGRGPLVLVRDESGSMSGASHALAVALEWALIEIARRDKRDFYSIPFGGSGKFHTWQAPQVGKPDPDGLLDHLGHFYGGGTEPYGPIKQALNIIAEQDLKADVLVITDGSFDQPTDDFLARAKAAEAKIVTVTIGGWGDAVAGKFSHKVVNVQNLVGDREQLREAIAEIV
jgi:uncharacterized protein with von Willebrand factor type A (vWA) domain